MVYGKLQIMIENLQTEVKVMPSERKIGYGSKILLLGSCFSDEIGRRMKYSGFHAQVNPFGTIYNPASIANSLGVLSSGRRFTEADVISGRGLYCSFFHHGSFSSDTPESFLSSANAALSEVRPFFRSCTDVVITLGTSRVYRYRKTGMIVSNCHKLPACEFDEIVMDAGQCEDYLRKCVGYIRQEGVSGGGRNVRVIFTVSPIRHIRDGLHENQLSKATLLLAVDKVCSTLENCEYFPSYEIFMDELRDYRWYAEDMCHPSPQAADYIWKRFSEYCFTDSTRSIMAECVRLRKSMDHRPLFPESDSWRKFVSDLENKKREFRAKYPDVIL